MAKERTLLAFGILMLFACSTATQTRLDGSDLWKRVKAEIASGEYTTARNTLAPYLPTDTQKKYGGCSGVCSTARMLLEEVNATERCQQILIVCQPEAQFRHEAAKCAENLERTCQGTRFGDQGNATSMSDRIAALKSMSETLPFGPKQDGEFAKTMASRQNACLGNMFWGYYREREGRDLYGKFASLVDCDSARLNDKESGGLYGNACRPRYLGSTIATEIVHADFMYQEQRGVLKDKVAFDSFEKCEQAISMDFKYRPEGGEELTIHPISQASAPKIIRTCYKERVTVCSSGEAGITDIDFYRAE